MNLLPPGGGAEKFVQQCFIVKLTRKILWLLLALFAALNALLALRYFIPHTPFPAQLDNFTQRRIALSLHAMFGAIALLAGPLQFVSSFREPNLPRHRVLGWIYCGAVFCGWSASLWIAPHAQTGWVASAGFLALGAAWIVTTTLAVRSILQRNIAQHRRWMLRSYALTAAAITLRIYLPMIFIFQWPFTTAYPAIAWLCWVPNALSVELYFLLAVRPPQRYAGALRQP